MRRLNVVLGPRSAAHRKVAPAAPGPSQAAGGPNLAEGFQPQPAWNLRDFSGKTISDLTFVNRYVGGVAAWQQGDMQNIDRALQAALTDAELQKVIAQYFNGEAISSTMLPSAVSDAAVGATVYKDTAEQLATQLHAEGALGEADPASSVINVMLPEGVVLSDGFSPGYKPPAGGEEKHERRRKGTIMLDPNDAADSKNGLGGYHGSIHLEGGVTIYYAVGVYSEGDNGIAAFAEPWMNVVATFYHELNEARTDADVEDVNANNDDNLLGWYSEAGQGEIGDLPINGCEGDLGLVFKEVPLADGSGTVPIQIMWSNASEGPAVSA